MAIRHATRALLPVVVLSLVAAGGFQRLVREPGGLLVDGGRPSVDHAYRGRARGIGNDLTAVFLPRFCYVVGRLRSGGSLPYWDTLGFGGRPLVGNPQAGLFYPPTWVAWRVGTPGALGWLTVAHLVWAGLGTYVLVRALGFSRPAGLVAGACFELSPYLIGHTFEGHYPHVWAASWYPWAFWAMTLCLRRNPVGTWALPVTLAAAFLVGHPQEWYYLVVVLAVGATVEVVRVWRSEGRRGGMRRLATAAALLGLSGALCAVDLLPQLAAGAWTLKSSSIPLAQINLYRLHSSNLFQLLSPVALGAPQEYRGEDNYWEALCSIGLAPLGLAVIGAAGHPARGRVRVWLILVVAAAVFAAGKNLGVYSLAYALLPGMNRFRVPARTLFLASLGASVLAGAGVDRLEPGRLSEGEWRRIRVKLGAVLLALLVVVLAATGLSLGRSAVRTGKDARPIEALAAVGSAGGFWVAFAGLAGVALVAGPGARGQRRAAWGLGAVAVVELVVYAHGLLVVSPAAAFLEGDGVGRAIRRLEGSAGGPFRVASFGTVYPDLLAAAGGIQKTNVNDGFQIQHAADVYERLYPLLDPSRPRQVGSGPMDAVVDAYRGRTGQAVLDLMGVRYVVTDRPLPLPRVEPACTVGALTVWENRSALPRAYVVPAVSPSRGKGRRVVRLDEFDPRTGVIMSHDPLPPGARQAFRPAESVRGGPDDVVIHARTDAPGLLVVAMTWMPGWTVTVDGRPERVERGNHWQQVVPLRAAGRHEVVLRYRPPALAVGAVLTLGGVAGWLGFGLVLAARALGVPGWSRGTCSTADALFTACPSTP